MAQLNISLPPLLKDWVETRIAQGRYSSASDYVRDLLRRDQEATEIENREWLRAMIQEGLDSGVAEGHPKQILRDIMAEHPSTDG